MAFTVTNLATGGNTSGSSLALTLGTSVPAGSTIVVAVSERVTAVGSQAVTDSAGNTYSRATSLVAGSNVLGAIYYAYNVSALSAGQSITITKAGTDRFGATAVSVTGVATTDPQDPTATNSAGANGQGSVQSGIPTNSDCLFIGSIAVPGNTGTFTQDSTHAAWATPPNEGTSGTGSTDRRVNGGNFAGSGTTRYTFAPTYGSSPVASVACIIALIPGTGGTGGGGSPAPRFNPASTLLTLGVG